MCVCVCKMVRERIVHVMHEVLGGLKGGGGCGGIMEGRVWR